MPRAPRHKNVGIRESVRLLRQQKKRVSDLYEERHHAGTVTRISQAGVQAISSVEVNAELHDPARVGVYADEDTPYAFCEYASVGDS
jgi:hypothetical protein